MGGSDLCFVYPEELTDSYDYWGDRLGAELVSANSGDGSGGDWSNYCLGSGHGTN